MLRPRLRALQRRLAPSGSRRHKYLRSVWYRVRSGRLWGPPRLTLLLAVDGTSDDRLAATLGSLFRQRDPFWELTLVGDRAAEYSRTLGADIRITAFAGSGDTAERLTAVAAAARGDFVAVIDAGDELLPLAIGAIGRATARRDVDIVYGDEVDLSKPDWSPNLLLAFPYTGRLCAIRRDAVASLGGWTADTLAADDYRILLAALRAGLRVRRVPTTIYRREIPGRVRLVSPDAIDARRRALVEHFAATGEPAGVDDDPGRPRLRITWPIAGQPLVSIVIATRDRLSLLKQCIESIERLSTYRAYEIVIADNDSIEEETLEYLSRTPHRVVKTPGVFNFSRINNIATREARGEFVAFLNNDTEVVSPGWMEELLQQAMRPGVGAVGGKLLFASGRVQHGGVILHDGSAYHLAYDERITDQTWPKMELVRDMTGVTAACLMMHRQRFLDAGGYDETFPE